MNHSEEENHKPLEIRQKNMFTGLWELVCDEELEQRRSSPHFE